MSQRSIAIAPRSAEAFILRAGEQVRIIDEVGGQPGDLVVFNAHNLAERFSQSRTRVENRVYRITQGHALWSNTVPPHVMLTVTGDTPGYHDLLFTPCNRYALEKRFGLQCDGCQEHLAASLSPWGIQLEEVPDPLNIFFNVTADPAGGMKVGDHSAPPGTFIELRAEMDCVMAISTCSAPITGRNPSGFTLVIS
jgi:uncharacterized protein YcgI (DUF1989 family)